MPAVTRDQIDGLLKRALELASEDRVRFLDESCGRDTDVRRSVERLLRNAEGDGELLLTPGGGAAGPLWEELARDYSAAFVFEAGDRIGSYRIVRVLGRGGMATVYLAERADGQFEQTVALKVLDIARDFDSLAARFAQERRILARLEHPNIARLIDGGATRSGQPYVVMEYVDGEPIDRYCDRLRLTIEQRLELFAAVAGAVQYAHGHLIVHRDIKPSNILVAAGGEAKLLDFGIAKILDADAEAPVTRSALHPMTPEYASPEQVRGEPLTTASDVYQLGYLLFYLLTGRSPYVSGGRSVADLVQAICNADPMRASAAVVSSDSGEDRSDGDNLGAVRSTTRERLRRRLTGDIDNILLTALNKDPGRRYPSASHFRDDLRRYLDGMPVAARKDTLGYRTRKFMRRHIVGVSATALVAASLAAGLGVAVWQAREKALEAANAQQVKNFVLELFERANPEVSQGKAMTVLELLEQGSDRVEAQLRGQPETQAELYRVLGNVFIRLGAYDRALPELKRALELRRSLFGADDPVIADITADMAHAYGRNGKFADAARLYRQALALRMQRHGKMHEDVARTLTLLGEAVGASDPPAGEQLLREALDLDHALYGNEHLAVARTLQKLGDALRIQGRLEEAEGYMREGLRQERLFLGPDHSDVASTLSSLASLLYQQGKTVEGEAAARESLAIRERVFGPDHPEVAIALIALAGALHTQARFAEASEFYRRAVVILHARLGDDNIRVAHARLSLAASLQALEEFDAAEQELHQALPTFVRLLGEDDKLVAITLQVRGGVLYELGRLDEAEDDLTRARDLTLQIWGEEHFQMANVLYDYGKVLLARRKPEDAAAAFRTVVELRRKQYGDSHLFVADPMVWLARCLVVGGRLADAEPLLLAGYPILVDALGADYKDSREARQTLQQMYTAWGRPVEAAAYQ